MVFIVEGVSLEESPQSVSQLYLQFGQLREKARVLVDKRREVVGANRSLYVTVREYAIAHNQDSKLDIIGTDNLVNNTVIVIKNPGNIHTPTTYMPISNLSPCSVRLHPSVPC